MPKQNRRRVTFGWGIAILRDEPTVGAQGIPLIPEFFSSEELDEKTSFLREVEVATNTKATFGFEPPGIHGFVIEFHNQDLMGIADGAAARDVGIAKLASNLPLDGLVFFVKPAVALVSLKSLVFRLRCPREPEAVTQLCGKGCEIPGRIDLLGWLLVRVLVTSESEEFQRGFEGLKRAGKWRIPGEVRRGRSEKLKYWLGVIHCRGSGCGWECFASRIRRGGNFRLCR
jgi:hypothetical protein